MDKKGTSVFSNSLIWFGAGVSIAEIVTGTYLGFPWYGQRAFWRLVIGHINWLLAVIAFSRNNWR